ncbi:MAG: MFS transporter [Rhodothalassiaceae bacterium]
MQSAIASLTALLIAAAILYAGNGLQGTLLAVRGAGEGFSALIIGLVMSAYYTGFIVGCRVIPFVVRQVGHIRTFTAMASLASAAALAHVLFIEPLAWMGLRIVTGFCFAGLAMVAESWINNNATNANRGRVLSVYRVVDLSALMVGNLLLTVATPDGFTLFALVSILISVSLVPVALSRSEGPPPIQVTRLDLPQLFDVSPLAAVGVFITGLSNTAFWALGPYFAQSHGFDANGVALFMAVVILCGALSQWPLGMVSDRVDRRFAILMTATGGLGAGLSLFMGDAMPSFLLVGAAVFGLFSMPLFGLCVALANDYAEADQYVTVNGGLLLLYGIGAIIGPLAVPFVMAPLGSAGLFLFTASAHGLLIVFGIYRILVRRPAAPSEREDFFVVAPPQTTSPVAFEMDPRAPDLDEELAEPDQADQADQAEQQDTSSAEPPPPSQAAVC